jgi:FkbM family methyltransferase
MSESYRLFLNRIKHFFFRVTFFKKHLVAYSKPYDIKVKFAIADGLGRDIYYKFGYYSEDFITRFLLNNINLQKGDLVIDIGANLGWYSLVLAHNRQVEVIAFEPEPSNFALLQENIALNNCTTAKAFNKAVGDKEATLQLHLYKSYNPARHSFIKQKNSIGIVDVPVVNLDTFLLSQGDFKRSIKLLKIDIEGYEFTALQNAGESLARTQNIITEFSPDLMKASGQNPVDYINLLVNAGFILQEVDNDGLHIPDFETIINQNRQVNLWGSRLKKA